MSQISVTSRPTSITPVNIVETIVVEPRKEKDFSRLNRVLLGLGIAIAILVGATAIVVAVKFRS